MPKKKYRVKLSSDERSHLLERLGRGERPAAEQTRVRVLLKVDEGSGGPAWPDTRTAEALEVVAGTVAGIRKAPLQESGNDSANAASPAASNANRQRASTSENSVASRRPSSFG